MPLSGGRYDSNIGIYPGLWLDGWVFPARCRRHPATVPILTSCYRGDVALRGADGMPQYHLPGSRGRQSRCGPAWKPSSARGTPPSLRRCQPAGRREGSNWSGRSLSLIGCSSAGPPARRRPQSGAPRSTQTHEAVVDGRVGTVTSAPQLSSALLTAMAAAPLRRNAGYGRAATLETGGSAQFVGECGPATDLGTGASSGRTAHRRRLALQRTASASASLTLSSEELRAKSR